MRLSTLIIGLPTIIFTASFAISNREGVLVSLWPFQFEVMLPLATLMISLCAITFILGWLVAWLGNAEARWNLKREQKRVKELEKQHEKDIHNIGELEAKLNIANNQKEIKSKKIVSSFFGG